MYLARGEREKMEGLKCSYSDTIEKNILHVHMDNIHTQTKNELSKRDSRDLLHLFVCYYYNLCRKAHYKKPS